MFSHSSPWKAETGAVSNSFGPLQFYSFLSSRVVESVDGAPLCTWYCHTSQQLIPLWMAFWITVIIHITWLYTVYIDKIIRMISQPTCKALMQPQPPTAKESSGSSSSDEVEGFHWDGQKGEISLCPNRSSGLSSFSAVNANFQVWTHACIYIYISSIFYDTVYCENLYSIIKYMIITAHMYIHINVYVFINIHLHYVVNMIHIYIYIIMLPVVPHKAVAEVSKIGNL